MHSQKKKQRSTAADLNGTVEAVDLERISDLVPCFAGSVHYFVVVPLPADAQHIPDEYTYKQER